MYVGLARPSSASSVGSLVDLIVSSTRAGPERAYLYISAQPNDDTSPLGPKGAHPRTRTRSSQATPCSAQAVRLGRRARLARRGGACLTHSVSSLATSYATMVDKTMAAAKATAERGARAAPSLDSVLNFVPLVGAVCDVIHGTNLHATGVVLHETRDDLTLLDSSSHRLLRLAKRACSRIAVNAGGKVVPLSGVDGSTWQSRLATHLSRE
jgi:hypothetical protein